MKNIPLFWPYVPKKRILKEINESLSGRWLGQGPKVDLFEKEFSKKFGYKYPLFVNSGTSALELAYHLIGLKPGDEVIVPVLDCSAGQMGLIRRGIKIVFADINKHDFNISYEDIKGKITKKTKAVVAVALGGVDIDKRIYPLCRKNKVPLIVDAAQHHEPKTLKGDYIVYSFQAIKHITTCDGGMLCLPNKKLYRRAKLLRWFGIDREAKFRNNFQAWQRRQMTFDIEEAGYKFQPTDIDACFGLASLPDLNKVIAHRTKLGKLYKKLISVDTVSGGSYWLFAVLSEYRDELAEHLKAHGIDTNMVHLRNDIYKIFGGKRRDLPNMDWIESRYLYIPLNTNVSEKDVRYISNLINEFHDRRTGKIS